MKLFAYSNFCRNDEITQRLKACCEGWHSVAGISDKVVSEKIREDGIDILIDLSGHTMYNTPAPARLEAFASTGKLARLLCDTGVAQIDYLLADPWTLPESEEKELYGKDCSAAGNKALLHRP